jgi:hypothetical protein
MRTVAVARRFDRLQVVANDDIDFEGNVFFRQIGSAEIWPVSGAEIITFVPLPSRARAR